MLASYFLERRIKMSRVLRSWGDTIPESKFEEVMPDEEDIIEQIEDDEKKYIENDIRAVDETFQKALEGIKAFSEDTGSTKQPIMQNELSEVEKNEWADRVKAMTNTEREFIITRFSTPELYDEIHRRIIKDAEYISNIRELVNQYDAL